MNIKWWLVLFCMVAQVSYASASGSYAGHAKAREFIEYMVREHGSDRADLQLLFAEASYKQSIVDAMTRPAEKVKEWKDYREIFITERRIRQGVEFWQEHRAVLEKAQAEYGVPIEIIVAIIGVETSYGRITGNYRVIDALSTLAFDYPARSEFFTRELENFLLLSREQRLNPLDLTGSYAGAMGYGQFMPSSYRNYAVDYNGDGVADVWHVPADAIGSVANYFVRHGWQTGGVIVARARIKKGYNQELVNKMIKPELTLKELKRQGFSPVNVGLAADTKAAPVKLLGDDGVEFWLGFQNFYTITRYNHSYRYAMAVTQLSELLARQAKGARLVTGAE